MDSTRLDELRDRIRAVDSDLLRLAAERMALARAVGEFKRERQLPVVDFDREALVLEHARRLAREHGLPDSVAEALVTTLIRASVTLQDQDNLRVTAAGAGKTAVVLGGAGRMGRWMTRFLATQAYDVGALDPAAPTAEQEWAGDALARADLVVCSIPPAAIADQYFAWCANLPAGLVVDIASIKTPLVPAIEALRKAGGRVASIHPMFGPSLTLLRDADVVVCDTGDREATAEVERLFTSTTAHVVHVPLAEHDRMMAHLLSLAHATAIAFALALPGEEHPVRSTTFQRLESLAASLVRESPDVYYEIQARNPHAAAAFEALRRALDRIVAASAAPTSAEFRELFEQARRSTPEPG
jgi:chorismate mutase/prephenate dehydrogenase